MTRVLLVTFLGCMLAPICLPAAAYAVGFFLQFVGIAQ